MLFVGDRMTAAGGEPLLIVGASARAAAESVARAGYRPYAIDLFADADLAEVADVRLSRHFPYDIPSLARSVPACDWLYVGGLENHPSVVDELAADRRLLGCSGEALHRAREPRLVRDELSRLGVSMPASIFDRSEYQSRVADGAIVAGDMAGQTASAAYASWLVKRRRSSGGLGVSPWRGEVIRADIGPSPSDDIYLQQHVAGESLGAVYLATQSRTYFLGASLQLTCPSRDGIRPFRYAGSVGPLPFERPMDRPLAAKLNKIGSLATSVFPMSGIFSLDFVLDAGNELRLLEINPRYTAGVELIERSVGKSLVGLHISACRGDAEADRLAEELESRSGGPELYGKRIVYAETEVAQVPDDMTKLLLDTRASARAAGRHLPVADIPRAGSVIRCDDPTATVFAGGRHKIEVLRGLVDAERQMQGVLAVFGQSR